MNRTRLRQTDWINNAAGLLLAGLLVMLPMGLTGCGGEEEKVTEAAPPPAPRAPARPRCALVDLREELQVSDKVVLTEAEAPPDCDERRNLLVFFDAFVNAQPDTLREMMSAHDSMMLDAMVSTDQLAPAAARIREVTLQTGVSPEGRPCVLAMYLLDDGYQAQLWYFKDEMGQSAFTSAIQPPDVVDRLSGINLVDSWFTVLQEEQDRANEYDDELDELTAEEGGRSGSASGSTAPPLPLSPSGPPGPRGPSSPGGPSGPQSPGPRSPGGPPGG